MIAKLNRYMADTIEAGLVAVLKDVAAAEGATRFKNSVSGVVVAVVVEAACKASSSSAPNSNPNTHVNIHTHAQLRLILLTLTLTLTLHPRSA